MSKRRKRHGLPEGHRFLCGCGMHGRGSCPYEGRAPKVTADKPSEATTEAYRGTSEESLTEAYAKRAALGIIGNED